MDGFGRDHLEGVFDGFETEIGSDENGFFARSMGREVTGRPNQEQALNDLNSIIYDAISKGEIVPDMD
jgi:hypothetical protein